MKIPSVLIVCTVSTVLTSLRPGAEWTITGENYADLVWLDKIQTKPTSKEVSDAINSCLFKEATTKTEKDQAKAILNDTKKTDAERLAAIIKILDLDK